MNNKNFFGFFWVLDLIHQNLSTQDWFLGWISEFGGGSRLGAEMSGTGILFKPKHDKTEPLSYRISDNFCYFF